MIEDHHNDWFSENQRYLRASLGVIRAVLDRRLASASALVRDDSAPAAIDRAGKNMKGVPALENLVAIFELSSFERMVLLMCAGVELDPSFAESFASLNNDTRRRYPTFGMALDLFADGHWTSLTPGAPLRYHRLIELTGGSTLTAQQPINNVARVTIQALAAVLGGTQSLHTNSMDEALALPTQEAAQVALRTQQIIAHESGVTDTIDPLAGSYFIESLTDELETRAKTYIDKIDEMGGALAAIEQGYVQREIQESAYRYQREIERGNQVIVGVNKFTVDEEVTPDLLRVDESVAKKQAERLAALRKRRDNGAVEQTLSGLKQAAQGSKNLMPHILTAVEAYATTGEICHTLRQVWGEYEPPLTI